MPVTSTARLALTQWSSPNDPPINRNQLNDDFATLDAKVAGFLQGNAADLPAPGPEVARFLFWAQDTSVLSFCTGTDWVPISIAAQLAAYLLKSGGTMTGAIDMAGQEIRQPTVIQAVDKLVTVAGATGTVTINGANGQRYRLNASGNVTLAWSNIPDGSAVLISFIQSAGGGRTLTFPAGTLFAGGTPPVPSTDPNARTELAVRRDGASYLVYSGGTGWATA